ncbi:MAG TPA: DUF1134 domain-containing protein [Hyphomicrobiaceae bacterium]|nr:DUF1134 domain-containing protein [Hyphomicrobiaceae bacterium]
MPSNAAIALLTTLSMLAHATPAASEVCGPETIAAVIDETGVRLRQLNADSQRELNPKLRELAAKRDWPEHEIEARGYEFLRTEEVRALDAKAGQLLLDLDRLGDDSRAKSAGCDRLREVQAAAAQLIEVTRQRARLVSARLEDALRPPAPKAVVPPSEPPKPRRAPEAAPQLKTARTGELEPPARPPAATSWDSATRASATPPGDTQPAPDGGEGRTFTAEDIRAAGRGFFGTLSAELASVIEYAFRSYGSPNGYVLGTEGGGALFAGVRYGQGKLVTKRFGERRIYWQGPSLGTDFGVDGSRVMFLVYNIESADEVLTRFAGIDGSAYLVGGVGITFLKKGRLILAPIRTGLGLRLGANIGYLKFTAEPSLNPF